MKPQLKLAVLLLASCAMGAMVMDEKDKDAEEKLAALRVGLGLKLFHWLVSVAMLVVVPCVASCYAIADRFHMSMALHIASTVYAFVEAIVLRFPDPSGHENRASRGTAWFLAIFYGFVLLNGAISEGTSFFNKDSKLASGLASRLGPLSYKIVSVMAAECGFVKAGMNMVAILGFCYDSHTGQCNAHGIMGMSFVAYGWFLSTMLVIPWLRTNRHKHSQEMYDSLMITAWGIVNTFTEHRPWEPWSHHDYQHTSMGIIFWACGMLGIYLSRNNRRSFLPSLTLIFTGYAMAEHPQNLLTSEKVHSFFGYVLMLAGVVRIMEICFLLRDRQADRSGKILSFQYLPCFCLVLAGILFMGANEEQIRLVINMGADHGAYIMVACSAACLVQLFYLFLLDYYLHLCGCSSESDYESLAEADVEQNLGDDHSFELDSITSNERL